MDALSYKSLHKMFRFSTRQDIQKASCVGLQYYTINPEMSASYKNTFFSHFQIYTTSYFRVFSPHVGIYLKRDSDLWRLENRCVSRVTQKRTNYMHSISLKLCNMADRCYKSFRLSTMTPGKQGPIFHHYFPII